MKQILQILELIGITILAFLFFLLVWSPMVLVLFIIGMIGLFITPWLGYILLAAFSILIILKFIIDLSNEKGTQY